MHIPGKSERFNVVLSENVAAAGKHSMKFFVAVQ
jgi:hypothetical protein